MSLQRSFRSTCVACFRFFSSWHPNCCASNTFFSCNFECWRWTLESSQCLVTTTLLSGSFLIMFTRVICSCSLHMWHWSHFHVSLSFHTKTWKALSWTIFDIMSLNADEFASIPGVFMPSSCQAGFCHWPQGLKWRYPPFSDRPAYHNRLLWSIPFFSLVVVNHHCD